MRGGGGTVATDSSDEIKLKKNKVVSQSFTTVPGNVSAVLFPGMLNWGGIENCLGGCKHAKSMFYIKKHYYIKKANLH